MPVKDYASHATEGVQRFIDLHFRHLRYDNTESIIDICYHAIQNLATLGPALKAINYDDRMQTPRGVQYSMFRDVGFVEIQFNERHGLCFRISFACPKALRGDGLSKSNCLEQGMLAALIGFDAGKSRVSVTFVEIVRRESTNAMKFRTNNDLQGMRVPHLSRCNINCDIASCVVCLADLSDLAAARRLLFNKQSMLSEQFVLVDLPNVLLPGFSWCLERLKLISRSEEQMAFSSLIATHPTVSNINEPPQYTEGEDVSYNLKILRNKENSSREDTLELRPRNHFADQQVQKSIMHALRHKTTLDDGQARALCENLSRGLAFTQGPPGTGKVSNCGVVSTLSGFYNQSCDSFDGSRFLTC